MQSSPRARCAAALVCSFGIIFCAPSASGGPRQTKTAQPQALAIVDGVPIERDEVDRLVGSVLWPLESRVFEIQQQALEALIRQRLLEREAARRKVSLQALIDAEVTAKAGAGTKEEVAAALSRFVSTLEGKSRVRVLLESPRAPRALLEGKHAPSKGPPDARITIVEFTDFHCSHCRDAEAVLQQVLSRYPARLVHRDLPNDVSHPLAREAHEAARCAEAQGQFWPYRERLFATPSPSGQALKQAAQAAHLDLGTFEKCVAAGTGRGAIEADAADAKRLGVTTTPTFFINGRELEGPATLETFVAAIQNATSSGSK
jgi:protein-disulfide isomerase